MSEISPRSLRSSFFSRLMSSPAVIASGAFVAIISLFPFVFTDTTHLRPVFDLAVYRGAIVHWLETGDIYSWTLPPEHYYGFTYPPFAIFLFLPMALFDSSRTLNVVFLGVNSLALVATLVMVFRSFRFPRNLSLGLSLWLFPLTLLTFPVQGNMWMGQINLIILFLILVDALLLTGTRFSGILSAIAASIKMTPALFILFFIARKDWRAVARFILTGVVGIVISFIFAPQVSWEFFTRRIFESNRVGSIVEPLSFNILGETSRLFFEPVNSILFAVLAIALLWVGFHSTRLLIQQNERLLAACTVGFLMLMVSPISWNHHWVWAIPAILGCALYGWHKEDSAYMFLAVSGTVLFCQRFQSWFSGHGWDIGYWPLWTVALHILPALWTTAFITLPWFRQRRARRRTAVPQNQLSQSP